MGLKASCFISMRSVFDFKTFLFVKSMREDSLMQVPEVQAAVTGLSICNGCREVQGNLYLSESAVNL